MASNFDQTLDKLKAYKKQLSQSSQLSVTAGNNHEVDGSLYEIKRLEQYSPSVEKLNRDDFEDIHNRPTMRLTLRRDEATSESNADNSPINPSKIELQHCEPVDFDQSFKIDKKLKQELQDQEERRAEKNKDGSK